MHTQGAVDEPHCVLSSNTNSSGETIEWRLWCRLCAKEDAQGNISVFFKDEQQAGGGATASGSGIGANCTDLSLDAAIKKYFWVNITREEDLPKMLCTECFSLVTSLANFSERVTKVQQMFWTLQNEHLNTKLDLHSLRLKYGLLDEEREHVLMLQQLPEVHYFESKPKINELEEKIFEAEMTRTNPLEQPRIRIKIKKENLLDEGQANDEDDDDDDDEDNASDDEDVEEEDMEDGPDPFDGDDVEDGSETGKEDELIVQRKSTGRGGSCDVETDEILGKTTKKKIKPKTFSGHHDLQTAPPKKRQCRHKNKRRFSKQEANLIPQIDDAGADSDSDLDGIQNQSNHLEDVANGDNIFVCVECPRRFKRVQHFRQHMKRTHSKAVHLPEVRCGECSRVFTTKYRLERHTKIHLPLAMKKVLPCPYCDKKFTTNALVQSHIKYVHMKERPFICEECGVAVRTNANLKTHMLTHTDYAPFVCDVCKKGFKNQIRLKNHMETHDPNKHICAECGLKLNSRATLNRHLLVHSDEMQHKCDYCGRAFKRAKALKSHLILHTGLKPYSCDFCDRTFANGSNCRSHKKKAHPEELAALEAAGGGKIYTRNIPKLEALKAVTKAADNLAPVVSKQSGRFAFGKKPKTPPKETIEKSNQKYNKPVSVANTNISNATTNTQIDLDALHVAAAAGLSANAAGLIGNHGSNIVGTIPTIDNIYSHIMKQATTASNNIDMHDAASLTLQHIKRPPSQASSSCISMEQEAATNNSDVSHLQLQHHIHLQQQQQQHSHTPTPNSAATSTAAAVATQHFYTQIVKQQQQANLTQMTTAHQNHALLVSQQHDEISSIRSPDSQASHMTDDHSNASTAHFYNIRQNMQDSFM